LLIIILHFFFFDIVEIGNTSADSIKNSILSTLAVYGLTDDYLKNNFVAFFSDGVSAMLGRISGVVNSVKNNVPKNNSLALL